MQILPEAQHDIQQQPQDAVEFYKKNDKLLFEEYVKMRGSVMNFKQVVEMMDLLQGLNYDQTGLRIIPDNNGNVKYIPLKDIYVDTHIQDSIAVIQMAQEYYNPKKEGEVGGGAPLEVCFMFPKENKSMISKMQISVGDKVVYTKVMEKEKAIQKYDDAVAKGDAAAIVKEKEIDGEELHQLDIGNIQPG